MEFIPIFTMKNILINVLIYILIEINTFFKQKNDKNRLSLTKIKFNKNITIAIDFKEIQLLIY